MLHKFRKIPIKPNITDVFIYVFKEYLEMRKIEEENKTKRKKIEKAIKLLEKDFQKKIKILQEIFNKRPKERSLARSILLKQIDKLINTKNEDEIEILRLFLVAFVDLVNSPILKEGDLEELKQIAQKTIDEYLEDLEDEITL